MEKKEQDKNIVLGNGKALEKIEHKIVEYVLINYAYKEVDSVKAELEFRPAPIMKGCYEGTQNQAKLKFREDGSFDVFWTGAFGGYMLYEGVYQRSKDTLVLEFTSLDTLSGNKFLETNGSFVNFQNNFDSTEVHYVFYKGECQGNN